MGHLIGGRKFELMKGGAKISIALSVHGFLQNSGFQQNSFFAAVVIFGMCNCYQEF